MLVIPGRPPEAGEPAIETQAQRIHLDSGAGPGMTAEGRFAFSQFDLGQCRHFAMRRNFTSTNPLGPF
jgi:hypothetical protein